MPSGFDVRLLGPFELRYKGEVISLGETRIRAFLALLALEPGMPLTFGQILTELWPKEKELGPPNVHRLRSDLRKELPAAVDALVTKDANGYKLAVDRCDVDAGRFADFDTAGDAARSTNPEAALTSWQRALDQWRGREALIGLARTDLGTIVFRAAGLQERRVDVAVKRSELRLALGADGREVSTYLAELETHHSNHVGLLELYGRTLAICGQAADAHRVLSRTFVPAGRGSSERVPTPRVRELLERIMRGETESLRPPAPTGARRPAAPPPASSPAEVLARPAHVAPTEQQPDDPTADVGSTSPEPPVKPAEVPPGPDRQPARQEGRWSHHLRALWLLLPSRIAPKPAAVRREWPPVPQGRTSLIIGVAVIAIGVVVWQGFSTTVQQGAPGAGATNSAVPTTSSPAGSRPSLDSGTFTSPTDGATVRSPHLLRGTAVLSPGRSLWVLLRADAGDPRFFVTTDRPIDVDGTGSWASNVGVGRGPKDEGASFHLHLISSPAGGVIDNEIPRRPKGEYSVRLADIPSDSQEIAVIRVVLSG